LKTQKRQPPVYKARAAGLNRVFLLCRRWYWFSEAMQIICRTTTVDR